MKHIHILLFLALVATGCSKKADPVDRHDAAANDTGIDISVQADLPNAQDLGELTLEEGCNPLGQEYDCLLPFPSDAFLAGTVTIPDVALPKKLDGAPVHAFDTPTANGFSLWPSILFMFDGGLDPDSLVAQADSATSITSDSPTLLIDTTTGEAVPHFSEVYLGGDEELQIGAIRPLVRLEEGRRYVVALQDIRLVGGNDVAAPRVFRALRDHLDAAELSDLSARFDADVFPITDAFGVERDNLDLAWDFTTRTRDDVIGDMLDVRNGTLEWLASNTPTVTIDEINEGADLGVNLQAHTFRHVEGHFTAPLWTETDRPGAVLAGSRGAREIVGTVEVPFSVTIPNSIATAMNVRGPFIQYGHGFFGRRDEVLAGIHSAFGDDFGYVMGAIEWRGMSRIDRDWVVEGLAEGPEKALAFAPRVYQGMANQLVFTEVIRTQLVNDDAMNVGNGQGRPAYEPDQTYFLGISQGHILGGTFMGLSPTIDRAVLNVGGASFGLILTRSNAFLLYARLLAAWMPPRDLLKFEALAPLVLEGIDPIAYAPLILSDPLPDAVPKQILLQAGVGDTAVPNVAMELHARALGISLVTPSSSTVPFMDEVPFPAASGLTFVDFGADPNTARSWQPVTGTTDVHDLVRVFEPNRQQMSGFLRPGGQIENTCSGPCVVP